MKRVLLVGAYERDNLGDLLFLLVTERYLQGADVVAAAPFSADMRAQLGRRIPAYGPLLRAESFDAIWTVGGQVGRVDLARAYRMSAKPRGAGAGTNGGSDAARARILRRAAGGAPPSSPYIPLPSRLPAQRRTRRRAQLGRDRRRPRHRAAARREAVVAALRGAAAITVRDRGSSRLLTDLGIEHRLAARRRPRPRRARARASATRARRRRSCRSRAPGCACSVTRAWRARSRAARSSRGGRSACCSPGPPPATTRSATTRRSPRAGARRSTSTSRCSTSAARSSSSAHIRRARVVIGTSLHVRIVAAAYGVPRVSLAKPKPTRYARLWDPGHAVRRRARRARRGGRGGAGARRAARGRRARAAPRARRPREPRATGPEGRRTRPAVSVIVPVFNPGADIDDCIESLLGQTLAPGKLELIFVDDGSTDETPARLDALAAEHAHVRVEHIPNSGWPGGRATSASTWRAASSCTSSTTTTGSSPTRSSACTRRRGGRGGHRDRQGRRPRQERAARHLPRDACTASRSTRRRLLGLLTPHKLFRRALLDEHGIRFPEGRRRLEDHLFVVHAYFHADGISVLADRPCYHWTHARPRAERVARGRSTRRATTATCARCSTSWSSTPSPGRSATGCSRTGTAARCSGASAARKFAAPRRRVQPQLVETIRRARARALRRARARAARASTCACARALLRDGRYEDLQRLARFEARAARRGQGARARRGRRARARADRDAAGARARARRRAGLRRRPPRGARRPDLDVTDEPPREPRRRSSCTRCATAASTCCRARPRSSSTPPGA